MIRFRGGFDLLVVLLGIALPARASIAPELAVCEEQLARARDGEAAAECLCDIATRIGPWREAAIQRLGQLQQERPEDPWFSLYLGNLKRQSPALGGVKAAEKLYRLSIDQARRRGLPRAEFSARSEIYRILQDAGRLDEAAAEMKLAMQVAMSSGDSLLETRAKLLQATYRIAQGEMESAYLALCPLRKTIEASGSYPIQRKYFFALGEAARQTGRFKEAGKVFEHVAGLAAKTGDVSWEAQARYAGATVRLDEIKETPSTAGREEVLGLARRALAVARAASDPPKEVQALWLLGSLEDARPARIHLERCFVLAGTLWEKSFCRSALARRLVEIDPKAARAASGEALSLAEESGDVRARTASWRERMRVSWALDSLEPALQDSEAALDAIETLRDKQGKSVGQPGLFSTWAEDYYWLSGRLLEKGETAKAFGVIERMRSRTLADALGFSRSRAGFSFASLEEIEQALAPDEALLSFQVAPWEDLLGEFGGGAWLLVFTHTGLHFHRLPDRTTLRQMVGTFTGLISKRDDSESAGAARLYRELLESALAELPHEVRRLVIVTDDALHRLPFSTLRPTPDGAPIADRYEISMAPSATLWLHWRKEVATASGTPALILADPPPRTLGLAMGRACGSLQALPRARDEGKAVRQRLGGESRLLLGQEATEAFLKKHGAEGFDIVHFATHSCMNDVEPDQSFVFLASGEKEDGFLRAGEIAKLPSFSGRVVVLSSCESASGEILRGEGVMSLARAFFQAGAPTVVASLWKLGDDDGAALFDRFYKHIAEGKSVAAALQAAQRDLRKDGAPAAAWAGVVVLGDGDRVPLPGGRKTSGPATVLIVLAVLALLSCCVLAVMFLRRARSPLIAPPAPPAAPSGRRLG